MPNISMSMPITLYRVARQKIPNSTQTAAKTRRNSIEVNMLGTGQVYQRTVFDKS